MKYKHIQRTAIIASAALDFNRVNRPCRKVLPTLKQRITNMFNYGS